MAWKFFVTERRLFGPVRKHGPFNTPDAAKIWARTHLPFGVLWTTTCEFVLDPPPPPLPDAPKVAPAPKKPWWKKW